MGDEDYGKEVRADEGVGSLGMAFKGMPPGYPEVKKVVEGSWAEEQGIEVGWIIVEVNGEDLIDMSKEIFMQHLKARPIVLYIEPPTPPPSDSEQGSVQEEGAPPEPRKSRRSSAGRSRRSSAGSSRQSQEAAPPQPRTSRKSLEGAAPAPPQPRTSRKSSEGAAPLPRKSILKPAAREEPQPRRSRQSSVGAAPPKRSSKTLRMEEAPDKEVTQTAPQPADASRQKPAEPVEEDAPRAARTRPSRKSTIKLQAERRRTSMLASSPLHQEEQVLHQENKAVSELRRELKTEQTEFKRAMSSGEDAWLAESLEQLQDDIERQVKSAASLREELEESKKEEATEISELESRLKTERSLALKYKTAERNAATDAKSTSIRVAKQVEKATEDLQYWEDEASVEKANLHYFLQADDLETIQEAEEKMKQKVLRLENREREEEAAYEKAKSAAKNEQLEEIAHCKSLVRAEESALNGLERSNAWKLDNARNEAAAEGFGFIRGEEAALRGLKQLHREVRDAGDGLPFAYDEECEILHRAYEPEEEAMINLNKELPRMEIVAARLSKDSRISEFVAAKNETIMEQRLGIKLEDEIYNEKVESGKLGRMLEETEDMYQQSTVAPVRRELASEEAERERLQRAYKQATFSLKRANAESTQETYEIGELTSGLSDESKKYGALTAKFQSLEQESYTWQNGYSGLQDELNTSETDAKDLRKLLRLEEKRSQEAKAESVRGPEAKAEILTFESTLAQTRIAADAQSRAREAAKIADKAEMSALRSALMNEESEVHQMQDASPEDRKTISEMLINKLKEELVRERRHASSVQPGDAGMEAYARSYKLEVAEASSLRSALLRQEAEIARLNAHHDLQMHTRLEPTYGTPLAFSAGYSSDVLALETRIAEEQHSLTQLQQELRRLESGTILESKFAVVNEVSTLESAIAVQQAQNQTLKNTFDQRAFSGGNDTAEISALRAALQNEEAEALSLRQKALLGGSVADRSGPTAGEVASLRAALRNEELQCRYLMTSQAQSATAPVSSRPDFATQRMQSQERQAIESALVREENNVSQLREQLAKVQMEAQMAHATPGDAQTEIAYLRSAIAKQQQHAAARQRTVFADPMSNTQRPGISSGGGFGIGQPSVDKTYAPIGGVMSGSEVAKMARQVEAAELERLTKLADYEEAVAVGAREENQQVANEANAARLAISKTEKRAAVLRHSQDDLSSNAASVSTQATFAADSASARIELARVETEIEKVELQIANVDPGGALRDNNPNLADFAESQQEVAEQQRQMQEVVSTLQVQLAEVEAEKEAIQIKCGKTEAGHEKVARSDKALYLQEMRNVRAQITWEEDQMVHTLKRKSVAVAASTLRATLALEEASMQKQLHARNTELATDMGQTQEAEHLKATLAQERAKFVRLEADLHSAERERDEALERVTATTGQHGEKMASMRKSLQLVQQANSQLQFVAADADLDKEAEAAEFDHLRAGHLRENVAASNLRDALVDAELRADAAHSTLTLQETEIETLRSRLKSERVNSGFGQREITEIDALQGALSQERVACSMMRRECTAAENRAESMTVEHRSEVEATRALLSRLADRDSDLHESSASKNSRIMQLEEGIQLEERKQQELQQNADKAEARIYAAESSLQQLELHEEDVVRRELRRGDMLADVRVASVERAACVIEEQAADWCMEAENIVMKEAGWMAGPVSLPHIVTSEYAIREKLVSIQGETQYYAQQPGASDDFSYSAAQLRNQLGREEYIAQSAVAEMHRARAAEGVMLQKSFFEVNDAAAKSVEASQQEVRFQERIAQYRTEIEAQKEELEDLKQIVGLQVPDMQEPATPAHLNSMLQAAQGALQDDMDPMAAHDALLALSAPGPSRQASPALVDGFPNAFAVGSPGAGGYPYGGASPGAASNFSVRTSRGEPQAMAGHASSLRAQAEGLRGEMRRFQKARGRSGTPSGTAGARAVRPRG